MLEKNNNEKGIIALGRAGKGSYPIVDFTNPKKVVIENDHGRGKVELTRNQWNNLMSRLAIKKG